VRNVNVARAILAGFIATLAMTAFMYAGPVFGLPPADIAAMLGGFLGIGWTMGMVVHFINGTLIFPLIYAFALYRVLPGSPVAKGSAFGVILWFLAQAIVMPMMGAGFFAMATPAPFLVVLGSLISHLIYGAILGGVTGPQRAAAVRMPERDREEPPLRRAG
jgi:uncharacterized membrane protein YagU involved in acid resistance